MNGEEYIRRYMLLTVIILEIIVSHAQHANFKEITAFFYKKSECLEMLPFRFAALNRFRHINAAFQLHTRNFNCAVIRFPLISLQRWLRQIKRLFSSAQFRSNLLRRTNDEYKRTSVCIAKSKCKTNTCI